MCCTVEERPTDGKIIKKAIMEVKPHTLFGEEEKKNTKTELGR